MVLSMPDYSFYLSMFGKYYFLRFKNVIASVFLVLLTFIPFLQLWGFVYSLDPTLSQFSISYFLRERLWI